MLFGYVHMWVGYGRNVSLFVRFWRHSSLIGSFVKRDLMARYKGSAIGLFWSVIHPLIMLALYSFVFSKILKVRVGAEEGTGNFAIYLFCGMLPWNAFAEAINRSSGVVLEHANLIKRTIFPAEILPVYLVVSGIVNELIGLVILFAALLFTGHHFSLLVLALPAILLLQVTFTVGLAWIVAGTTVFIRDLGQIMGVGLTLWLFLTPIFYPPTLVPAEWRILLSMNPMYAVVEAYRSLILLGRPPAWPSLAVLGVCALTTFVIGHRIFRRMQPAFADVI